MDVQSYVSGFVQGIIIAELLVCIIHLVLSIKQTKNDMKKLDTIDRSIDADLKFSKAMVEAYDNHEKRLQKLETKKSKTTKKEDKHE